MTQPEKIYKVLQERVKMHFAQHGIQKTANWSMKAKTIILFSSFLLSYLTLIIFNTQLPFIAQVSLFVVFTFAWIGIGFNIMHDANHGAYSSNKNINKLLGYSMNILGYNKWVRVQQHNIRHHVQTNIDGHDDDIYTAKALRFAKEQPHHRRHQFQWLYFLPLYALETLIWVVVWDYMKFYTYAKEAFNNRKQDPKKNRQFLKESRILYGTKVFYFAYMILIPVLVWFEFWYVIKAFILMHIVYGLFIALVFQCAHIRTDAKTHGEKLAVADASSFVEHQVESTGNFAPRSKIFSRFIGWLTHQIEHHLFPNICHVHYPKVRPIVKATLLEYGLPYNEYSTFAWAIWSHTVQLRELSWKPKVVQQ